jgi:hypothetical protein
MFVIPDPRQRNDQESILTSSIEMDSRLRGNDAFTVLSSVDLRVLRVEAFGLQPGGPFSSTTFPSGSLM